MRRLIAMAGTGAVLGLALASTAAADGTYSSTETIVLTSHGIGSPYPASITVSGESGAIADVNVVLDGIQHSAPGDIDLLLVGPDGSTAVVLLSDVGGSTSVSGVDVTIDQDAPSVAPSSGPLVTGSYRPTNHEGSPSEFVDGFPSPAPSGSTGSLDAFNGKPANGTWTLYAVDDTNGASGEIDGWSLVLDLFVLTAPGGTGTTATTAPGDPDPCAAAPEDGFGDVAEGSTHEANIDCVVAYGIATGFGDGTYRPAVRTSRAQMASFVARAVQTAGIALPPDPPDGFTDDEGSTHELRIDHLRAVGVIGGNGEAGSLDHPTAKMRRDHLASFLAPAYEVVAGTPLPPGPDAFTDEGGNSHEADINALAAADVVSGTGGSLYEPSETVSRGQVATYLARFLDLLTDEGYLG